MTRIFIPFLAFCGALVFGLTGFGSALVTIPLATHLVPLPFALALFALTDLVSALGVTVGYHRYFTHRAFKATRPLRNAHFRRLWTAKGVRQAAASHLR